MPLSLSEKLTIQFYEWERVGRGWYTFNTPVDLEPIFEPFFAHYIPTPRIDDGKRHSVFTFISESVRNVFTPKEEEVDTTQEPGEPQAYPYVATEALCAFSISLPEGEKFKADQVEQFLVMLSYCKVQICFEIIATPVYIRLQFVVSQSDAMHVQGQLKAYFPKCILHDQTGTLEHIIGTDMTARISILDFGLKDEFTRPFAMAERLEPDPLTGLFGVLEHLQEKEHAAIQILFKGTLNPWAESIMRSVTDSDGSSFFQDAPEMPKLALEKISSPLFAVGIRVLGVGTTDAKAINVAQRVGAAIIQSSRSNGNSLIPLTSNGYPFDDHLLDVIDRQTHRGGMIINAKELATFVHYPFSITSKKLERDIRKTKEAPRIAEGHEFWLGRNIHQGVERIPTLSASMRLKHMHVIGATGTGKSTFLQTCIVQDILLGNGLAVLDPHGDLIESVLPYIPEARWNDVIIVDPADSDYPVGFNILTAHSEVEKEILASDLVAVFRRLSTSFGDQMHSVLANAILAFLESSTRGTLIDLRRFLIEKPFREEFLKTVQDPNIVYYWQKEYPLLKTSSIGPILTRLDSFLRPKVIRNMVSQKKSLDFENILDSRKILFIKLSQGLIGTENSYLLGTFFVSKIYQAAMARQAQSKAERKDFFLYIDEFQNFITPSMSQILSGTRKYGLGCILAHQDMIQLQKADNELASAVISNAVTRVCFRLGDIDAKRFEDGFSSFEAEDLQNLGVGQAIARIERPEFDFNISTLALNEPTGDAKLTTENVIGLSRKKYGTAREEVEKALEYLRGEQSLPEIEPEVKKPAVAEPVTHKEELKESKVEQPVYRVPDLSEAQKAKTSETLAKNQEITAHRGLQMKIKKLAEDRGFKALIEEPTPDGKGRVDVSLERNGRKIACEIGITTSKEWETHNIQKCLAAGYDLVIAIATERKGSEALRKEILKKIDEPLQSKVLVLEPDEFVAYLDRENAKDASTEKLIKGRRVHLEFSAVSEETAKQKRDAIAKLVLDSIKKGKK